MKNIFLCRRFLVFLQSKNENRVYKTQKISTIVDKLKPTTKVHRVYKTQIISAIVDFGMDEDLDRCLMGSNDIY